MARGTRRCDLCGRKGARIGRTIRSYGRGSREFLVRNIPTIRCPHCGETYMTADTLHDLERIKLHHRRLAVPRRIAVASFPSARRKRAG